METGFKELAPVTSKSAGRGPRDKPMLQLEPETSGGRHPRPAGPQSWLLTSADWVRPTTPWRLIRFTQNLLT